MRTRQVVILLACLLCLSNYVVRAQASPKTTPTAPHLCWREGVRLTWRDFRAPQCYDADGSRCSYASFVAASTAANVLVAGFVDRQGLADYRVTCFFIRDSSWVNPEIMVTSSDVTAAHRASTLMHEQLHFDIYELVARKIRRYIVQRRVAGDDLFGPTVAAEIPCLLNELKALNTLYDDEVNFRPATVTAVEQRRWEQRVARELRALAAYKSTAATCP